MNLPTVKLNTAQNVMRKAQKIRMGIGFAVAGALFLAMGIFFLLNGANKADFAQASATIARIETFYDTVSESESGRTFVDYTVDGTTYRGIELGSWSSSMKEGDKVNILYDVNDPGNITTKGGLLVPYVAILAGLAALVFGVVTLRGGVSKSVKEMDEYNKVDMSRVDPAAVAAIENDTAPMKDYLYHFSGKFPKLNYVMEDENREAVYEAVMEEVNLLKAVPYRFIDRRTGKERTMQIGHTIQTGSGDEHVQVNLSSYFKIDGVKCWDYLAELGYSFEVMARGIRPIFDVYHYGVKVAHVETGGTNDVREKDNPIGKLPVNGIFRVNCRESDVEELFMVCFCISRAIFYD